MAFRILLLIALSSAGCVAPRKPVLSSCTSESPTAGRRIVFVVEATGDMMKRYDAVHEFLNDRFSQLGDNDQFNVIVAGGGRVEALDATGLIHATEISKRDALRNFDIAHGTGDIRPAILRALEMKPSEICLILDGWSSGTTLNDFWSANSPGKRIRFDVVSFGGESPDELPVLQRIATQTGGTLLNVKRTENEFEKLSLLSSRVIVSDSAGMLSVFDEKGIGVRRLIDRLGQGMRFNVLLYAADGYLGFEKNLVNAKPDSKRKAYDWLDGAYRPPDPPADPIPALRAAFALKPNVIYFLVERKFANAVAIRAEIRKLNVDRRTCVHTYAFPSPIYVDKGAEADHKFLKAIAEENGGRFRVYDPGL